VWKKKRKLSSERDIEKREKGTIFLEQPHPHMAIEMKMLQDVFREVK
jgi:hypothetical protein